MLNIIQPPSPTQTDSSLSAREQAGWKNLPKTLHQITLSLPMAALCDHHGAPGYKDFKQPLSVLQCVSSLQLAGVPRLHLERLLQKLKLRYSTSHQNLINETPLLERNQK